MEWTMFDKSMVLLSITCGWFIAIGIWWLLTRKSRIYWSEKEQQIMTMGGKCLYDKAEFKGLRHGLYGDTGTAKAMDKRMDTLQAQLQCSAKTEGKHKMFYVSYSKDLQLILFKCAICGLVITKTKKELSNAEREHLTGLGVIKKGTK